MQLKIIIVYNLTTMYVCLCHAVKEAEIKAAAKRGCDDLETLGKTLRVGTRCGICRCEAQSIIDAVHQHRCDNVHVLDFAAKDMAAPLPA